MKTVLLSILFAVGILSNAPVFAGDVKAGQTKSAMCAACHGANGVSAADNYPNLAGQHADYIVKQLNAFKSGERKDMMMAPMAAGLSDADMVDLAAYFASFTRDGQPLTPSGDESVAAESTAPVRATTAQPAYIPDATAGKLLYQLGDQTRGITACIGCHGKDGNSDVLINPNLAKQHPQYIEKQLRNFKVNSRHNAVMNQVSANLSIEDIANLGAYFIDTSAIGEVKASSVVVMKSFVGDVVAGKAKAATCAACHGADGNPAVAMYPALAGQSESYIVKQLKDFKAAVASDGTSGRVDPVMAGMVAPLSNDDMQNLAAYFSSQALNPIVSETNAKGKKLFISGDPINGITACMACHSINGKGMDNAAFPSIAGQSASYLKAQLEKFRSASRGNDKNSMMRSVALNLSDQDIEAVSQYLASLK